MLIVLKTTKILQKFKFLQKKTKTKNKEKTDKTLTLSIYNNLLNKNKFHHHQLLF